MSNWLNSLSRYTLRVILYYLQPLIVEERQSDGVKLGDRERIEDFYEEMIWRLQGFNTKIFNFGFEHIEQNSYRIELIKDGLLKVKKILQSKGNNLSIKELRKIEGWKFYEELSLDKIVAVKRIVDTINELLLMMPDKNQKARLD